MGYYTDIDLIALKFKIKHNDTEFSLGESNFSISQEIIPKYFLLKMSFGEL